MRCFFFGMGHNVNCCLVVAAQEINTEKGQITCFVSLGTNVRNIKISLTMSLVKDSSVGYIAIVHALFDVFGYT